MLAADLDRQQALGDFLTEWHEEAGPVDEGGVDAMARRYEL